VKRREFVAVLGGAAAALMLAPLPIAAQQAERRRRLGVLTGYDERWQSVSAGWFRIERNW
jgi:hypothetical protein